MKTLALPLLALVFLLSGCITVKHVMPQQPLPQDSVQAEAQPEEVVDEPEWGEQGNFNLEIPLGGGNWVQLPPQAIPSFVDVGFRNTVTSAKLFLDAVPKSFGTSEEVVRRQHKMRSSDKKVTTSSVETGKIDGMKYARFRVQGPLSDDRELVQHFVTRELPPQSGKNIVIIGMWLSEDDAVALKEFNRIVLGIKAVPLPDEEGPLSEDGGTSEPLSEGDNKIEL